jgi:hypothetical protein
MTGSPDNLAYQSLRKISFVLEPFELVEPPFERRSDSDHARPSPLVSLDSFDVSFLECELSKSLRSCESSNIVDILNLPSDCEGYMDPTIVKCLISSVSKEARKGTHFC